MIYEKSIDRKQFLSDLADSEGFAKMKFYFP